MNLKTSRPRVLESGSNGTDRVQPHFPTWPEVQGIEIDACPDCERSWQLTLNDGLLESMNDRCLVLRAQLESTPHEIGFASEVIHNDMTFQNAVLYNHPTADWVPYGTGSLAQQRFNFILELE